MIVASPVAGSIRITLLASLFANRSVPPSPAMGPSALLPCQSHTVFQLWPAAITPGIAVVAATGGSGGGVAGCGAVDIGIPKGAGFTLHLASTAASPAFCHDCWLLPRGNEDDGPCAATLAAAAQPRIRATAILDVMRCTLTQAAAPQNATGSRLRLSDRGGWMIRRLLTAGMMCAALGS